MRGGRILRMSPELETLDQLQCSDMPIGVIRGLYPNPNRFVAASVAMLRAGEIRLTVDSEPVPPHEWDRELEIKRQTLSCP